MLIYILYWLQQSTAPCLVQRQHVCVKLLIPMQHAHTKAASLCMCSSQVAHRTWIALKRAISRDRRHSNLVPAHYRFHCEHLSTSLQKCCSWHRLMRFMKAFHDSVSCVYATRQNNICQYGTTAWARLTITRNNRSCISYTQTHTYIYVYIYILRNQNEPCSGITWSARAKYTRTSHECE